jgi:flavin reductase (DIM6/NTAB) family NADH-FMN oxidoreductase RutF
MHYDLRLRNHGLRHDPFKALMVPRPIGWIGTVDAEGRPNLAPYSFFNGVADRPAMVAFSSAGMKDSLRNIEQTGEFTCSLATWDLRDAMNMSSAPVAPGVDEFALAGLTPVASLQVKPPRVGESPAAMECRHWKTIALPSDPKHPELTYQLVIGEVLVIHIDDAYIQDGMVGTGAMRPLARLGYMDYAVVTPETVFTMNRPEVDADGRTARPPTGDWDGIYR